MYLLFLSLDDISPLNCQASVKEFLAEEALIYVAGYVAYRFRFKHPFLGIPTKDLPTSNPPTWIEHISKGGLLYPTENLINVATILEKEFYSFHKNFLSDEDGIFTKVAHRVKEKLSEKRQIPWPVLLCLVRTRTYIRLRELNKKRKESCSRIRIAARSVKSQKFYT